MGFIPWGAGPDDTRKRTPLAKPIDVCFSKVGLGVKWPTIAERSRRAGPVMALVQRDNRSTHSTGTNRHILTKR